MAVYIVTLFKASNPDCFCRVTLKGGSDDTAIVYAKRELIETRRSTRLIHLFYDAWKVCRIDKDSTSQEIGTGVADDNPYDWEPPKRKRAPRKAQRGRQDLRIPTRGGDIGAQRGTTGRKVGRRAIPKQGGREAGGLTKDQAMERLAEFRKGIR